MAKRQLEQDGRRTKWRNPVLRFEESCRAPAQVVYELLADLQSHLEWGGRRQFETTRLLTMQAPPGPAGVGTEFFTTGSDGKVAQWSDRSVVTEATSPEVFEFVTEGRRQGKSGSRPWLSTAVHRYEIAPGSGGGAHPSDRRAEDPSRPGHQPDHVPDQRQVHAARLPGPLGRGRGAVWNQVRRRKALMAPAESELIRSKGEKDDDGRGDGGRPGSDR